MIEVVYVILFAILFFLIVKKTMADLTAQVKSVYAKYKAFIDSTAESFSIDPRYVAAIVMQESRGNAQATGSAGERGLMQIMPDALTDVNLNYGFGFTFDDMYDPEDNIRAGTAYLAILRHRFSGDMQKAIQAYNAGAGNVTKNPNASISYFNSVSGFYNSLLA